MNTDKRVFSFVGDGEFLLGLNSAVQAAVSKCLNLFCVILDNGCYQSAGGHPTIFRETRSMRGCLLDFGFSMYDFTDHLKNKMRIKDARSVINNMRGPAAIIIRVNKGIKKDLVDIEYSKKELKHRLMGFVSKRELGTSLFIPPLGVL
ncbi:unnamed protein product [marine sediment metagenome]|uniref:Thiamine pyrophosphate enzyme TPP-binding domain-containing protein n=1 Tax=marine sediment metagenome TaxID=412755 RepID=X1CYI2_9ZZZZ